MGLARKKCPLTPYINLTGDIMCGTCTVQKIKGRGFDDNAGSPGSYSTVAVVEQWRRGCPGKVDSSGIDNEVVKKGNHQDTKAQRLEVETYSQVYKYADIGFSTR